jgi:hypothetical protein
VFATLLINIASAIPPQPAQITPTTEEAALLASGGVAFRYNPKGESVGIIDISAPPATVIAEVMNLPPRIQEIGPLLELTPYEVSGGQRYGARWEVGASIYSATFHVIYDCDLSAGWCVFDLDPDKENDLQSTSGSYQVYPHGDGSRLVYRSSAQSTILPDFLMKKFAGDGAVDLLTGIQRRAEG